MAYASSDSAACVSGPWLGGLLCVEECDLVAVPERVSDERWWALKDELADGAVAGAEEVDRDSMMYPMRL